MIKRGHAQPDKLRKPKLEPVRRRSQFSPKPPPAVLVYQETEGDRAVRPAEAEGSQFERLEMFFAQIRSARTPIAQRQSSAAF